MKTYQLICGHDGRAVVSGVTFTLAPGECVLLAGRNGSGKTTLLKTLAGVLKPLGGTLDAGGKVSMIPTGIPKVRGFTLESFIRTGCYREFGAGSKVPPDTVALMDRAMEILGIEVLRDKDIASLSDGEFQLGCIATALSRRCDWMLLDEPVGFLDTDNRAMVLRTLSRTARETGTGIIFSSHEVLEAARVADRVFAIGPDGSFQASPGTSSMTPTDSPGTPPGLSDRLDTLRHAFRSL